MEILDLGKESSKLAKRNKKVEDPFLRTENTVFDTPKNKKEVGSEDIMKIFDNKSSPNFNNAINSKRKELKVINEIEINNAFEKYSGKDIRGKSEKSGKGKTPKKKDDSFTIFEET